MKLKDLKQGNCFFFGPQLHRYVKLAENVFWNLHSYSQAGPDELNDETEVVLAGQLGCVAKGVITVYHPPAA